MPRGVGGERRQERKLGVEGGDEDRYTEEPRFAGLRFHKMIIQITLGVACGIVLAVLVLRYWSYIVRGSFLALGLAIVLTGVVLVGLYLWDQRSAPLLRDVSAVLVLIGTVALTWRTFELLYSAISHAYPLYGQLYKGDPPWNRGPRNLVRKTIIAVVWLLGAVVAALIFVAISHFYRAADS